MAFDDDTRLRELGDGAWEGEIVEHWWTPRGPLGGYVMAIVLRAMTLAVADDERPARSLSVHFLRPPEAGPVTVRAAVERAGRSLTSVSARLEQDGRLLSLALAAFSKPWPSPLLADAPMPEVAPPDPQGPHARRVHGAKPPPFLDRLTMQGRFGDAPFSRSEHAEAGGWLGLREERPLDAPAVALLADAWFPAPWPRLNALAPAPTIDMTVHFRGPLPAPSALVLGRFRSRLTREGFFDEDGELWTPDGTLVAQSRQLGLLIGAEA
ncbi:MAG TPA: thioesterase family protein [Solirubrobacteraceae bacterium]|nr:thioesterase family protein [Solirubrobacteraceae bacterium]